MQSVILFSVWSKMNFNFFFIEILVSSVYIFPFIIIAFTTQASGSDMFKALDTRTNQPQQQQENKKVEIFLQCYRIWAWSVRTNSSSTELLFIRQTERTSEYSIIVVEHEAKKISQKIRWYLMGRLALFCFLRCSGRRGNTFSPGVVSQFFTQRSPPTHQLETEIKTPSKFVKKG